MASKIIYINNLTKVFIECNLFNFLDDQNNYKIEETQQQIVKNYYANIDGTLIVIFLFIEIIILILFYIFI